MPGDADAETKLRDELRDQAVTSAHAAEYSDLENLRITRLRDEIAKIERRIAELRPQLADEPAPITITLWEKAIDESE